MAADGRPVVGLGLKVRYAPFITKTFTKKIASTFDRETVLSKTLELVEKIEDRPHPAARGAGRDGDARRRPARAHADSRRVVTRGDGRPPAGGPFLAGLRTAD